MTGRHGGVVTLLEKEATHSVLRVWCAAHQMDLVMKSGFSHVDEGKFVKVTEKRIVYLRRQKNLIKEMGGAAKKLTNRWLYMGNALRWILQNHFCLAEYLDGKTSVVPTPQWWVNAAVVYGITSVVNVTFVKIQANEMILSQQMAEIALLVDWLRGLLSVEAVSAAGFDHSSDDIITEKYWLKELHLVDFVKDQGTFVMNHLDNIQQSDKKSTLRQLGEFVLHIIEGMELVQAERDSNNDAAPTVAPPVMPSELVEIAPRDFGESILGPRQLSKFWTEAQVQAVERKHRELCNAKMLNALVSAALDEENYETNFNDGWDAIEKAAAPATYSHLRKFCCGLATVFANTASVESDFSILKWELNDRRTALTSLGLEGIFQAKQFEQLDKL